MVVQKNSRICRYSCAAQSNTTSSSVHDGHNTVVGILHTDEVPV